MGPIVLVIHCLPLWQFHCCCNWIICYRVIFVAVIIFVLSFTIMLSSLLLIKQVLLVYISNYFFLPMTYYHDFYLIKEQWNVQCHFLSPAFSSLPKFKFEYWDADLLGDWQCLNIPCEWLSIVDTCKQQCNTVIQNYETTYIQK